MITALYSLKYTEISVKISLFICLNFEVFYCQRRFFIEQNLFRPPSAGVQPGLTEVGARAPLTGSQPCCTNLKRSMLNLKMNDPIIGVYTLDFLPRRGLHSL